MSVAVDLFISVLGSLIASAVTFAVSERVDPPRTELRVKSKIIRRTSASSAFEQDRHGNMHVTGSTFSSTETESVFELRVHKRSGLHRSVVLAVGTVVFVVLLLVLLA